MHFGGGRVVIVSNEGGARGGDVRAGGYTEELYVVVVAVLVFFTAAVAAVPVCAVCDEGFVVGSSAALDMDGLRALGSSLASVRMCSTDFAVGSGLRGRPREALTASE